MKENTMRHIKPLIVVAVSMLVALGVALAAVPIAVTIYFHLYGVSPKAAITEAVPTGEVRLAPIDEIKPGMTGYCLSPDDGGIDRISVAIKGVFRMRGYEPKVIIQATSGRILASGIAQGMSGSPVYLDDGRLIGALSYTPGDSDNTAFVTPIGELLAQGRHAQAGEYGGKVPPVPSYAAFCTVWGDGASCSHATLTLVRGGVLYATGHSFDQNIQSSSQQTAVFSSSVTMTLKRSPSVRLNGLDGEPVGTVVWDGANGSVIALGKVPDQFAVHLTMPDAAARTLHGIRQNIETPSDMQTVLRNLVSEQIDMSRDWDARISVSFADGSSPLVITDEWGQALDGMKEFLERALVQSPEAIGDIHVAITASGEKGEFELQKLHVNKTSSGINVQSILSGVGSHHRLVVRQDISGAFAPKPGLAWYLGRELHEKTLSLMPAVKAVPILNALGDRRAVYLACVECEPWTNPNLVEIRGTLGLDGLAITKAATMPFTLGEQKPEKKTEKPTIQIIAGVTS